MSTPDHDAPPAGTAPETGAPLTRQASADVTSTGPAGPTATVRAAVWAGCHLGELAAITVTGSLAITVSVWFAALAALLALAWAGQEYRAHQADKAQGTGQDETREAGERA
ncbi:hypothetical protein [Amycolatopsis jejuensis]|uniref:hypothetical protein n=1 Tax=Amycolatopsis jejuensis TaxID=330084 RepID=UPI0005244E96|nr:hypothetical protein [Amycolatopsis jejuensis]